MSINKLIAASATVAVLGTIVVACGGSDPIEVASGTVIQNATVVNTRDGSLTTGMNVVIDGGKIQKITGAAVRAIGAAQTVDATGRFVVPGYNDMHTHLFNVGASDPELPLLQNLLIANGITGIREMGGSPALVLRAKQFNDDLAAGKFDAPEILQIPGQIISGGAPAAASVSAAAASQEVQAQKAYGAGFIKAVGANRDATFALLSEAKNQGLTVAGHLNPTVSATEASNAGWRGVEHLGGASTGMLLDCSSDEDSLRAMIISGNGAPTPPPVPTWTANAANAPIYQRVFDTYNASKCATVAQTFVKNETWHIPTLIRNRTLRFVDDSVYRNDPNLIYVSKATRASWEAAAQRQLAALPASTIALYHRYFDRELGLAKLLKQNGVKMLSGSDMSISPILTANWVIPGVGLHQEFALLAASGISPLEVLQMTTLNGAQFLNREATMGTVDENKNADLVLLDANPIESVANLGKISGLFLKGKYFSAAALAKLKSDVAQAYESQPAPARNAVINPHLAAHVD